MQIDDQRIGGQPVPTLEEPGREHGDPSASAADGLDPLMRLEIEET
ncbi:MAG TPA: hypothetical protein VGG57_09240 [Stellaceae bacterium]